MKSIVRAAAVAGAAAALIPLTAATSEAAPLTSCITVSESEKWGRGEITLCPQSDGSTRLTGWIEDLLPGGGWTGPDDACVSWEVTKTQGPAEMAVWICPHFGPNRPTKKTFDFTETFDHPVTGAYLSFWYA